MSKPIKQLSDAKVRTAKSQESEYKLFDGGGLYLLVTPSGGRLWYLKYRFEGKEKKLAIGPYPEVSLEDARLRKAEARKQIVIGIDPGAVRKAQKQAKTDEKETFELIAREWHTKFTPTWTPGHASTIMARLQHDLFPWVGARPINEIKRRRSF